MATIRNTRTVQAGQVQIIRGIRSMVVEYPATYHAGSKVQDGYGPGVYIAKAPRIDLELTASFRDHDMNWDPKMDRTTVSAKEQDRRDAITDQIPPLPEHRLIFATMNELGEAPFGLTGYLQGGFDPGTGKARGISFLERQLIEDVHVSGSGDVLRNTDIDRDPRPYHLRPLVIMRTWSCLGWQAEKISEYLTILGATSDIEKGFRPAKKEDFEEAYNTLGLLAREIQTMTEIPGDDAMSNATRYFDDTSSDNLAAEDENEEVALVEGAAEEVDYHGADRGFTQFVRIDDARDDDYHDRITGEINPMHPACPWSLKQPAHVQGIGKALRTARTSDDLKAACGSLIDAKTTLSTIQASVLWGIYFRTKMRMHIAKYGQPSAKARKFEARLTHPGETPVNLAAAAVAINTLSLGDKAYVLPIWYKARKAQAQAAQV